MRQRIGLERALIASPRIVLLDEPFTGLDEVSSQLLLSRLAALRDGGAIVLLSTHDPVRIERLLDAAIVLRGGRLVANLQNRRSSSGVTPDDGARRGHRGRAGVRVDRE